MTYSVRYGETITDVVMNSTGLISNWSAILVANGFDEWVPSISAGDELLIPDDLPVSNEALTQLTKYPANNQSLSINDIYTKISFLFATLAAAPPVTAPVIPIPVPDTNTYYQVRYGETIGDVVMNSTGNIANWPLILDANGYDEWVPLLSAGQILTIPPSVVTDPNTLRQLKIYPANNASWGDIYDKINVIFGIMNPNDWILATAFWRDSGFWRDSSYWID